MQTNIHLGLWVAQSTDGGHRDACFIHPYLKGHQLLPASQSEQPVPLSGYGFTIRAQVALHGP